MLHNFYEHIIPETLEIPINQIGTFLVENKDRILSLFEQYPLMWRWPLCLLQDQIDDRITHSIRASLQEKPTDDILERLSKAIDNTIILLCFCLVLTRNKKSSEMKRKYGNVLEKTRIAEYIHDEIEFQITTSW